MEEAVESRRILTLDFLKDKFMSTKITEEIPVEAGVTLETAAMPGLQSVRTGGGYKPRGNQMSMKYFND